MNIAVTPSSRLAVFSSPAEFAAGESTPLVLTGLESPDVATLQLALYTAAGTLLALCSAFSAGTAQWTGTIDCATDAVDAAFSGKRPDHREQVCVVIRDGYRLWALTNAEMANDPLRGATSAPDASKTYLTADLFADIDSLPDDPTDADRNTLLAAILEALKQ